MLRQGMPLKKFAAALLCIAGLGGRAEAESQWREYAYGDQQFAVAFPAAPAVAKIRSDDSAEPVSETVYLLQQPASRFEVTVFDLLRAPIGEQMAIARSVAALRRKGEITLDIASEVQGHWGRYLSITAADGSRTIAAVYFRNDRLYEIAASAPAASFEAVSSDLVRFQQSLRFFGSLKSRRFAPPPAGGVLQNVGGRLFGAGGGSR